MPPPWRCWTSWAGSTRASVKSCGPGAPRPSRTGGARRSASAGLCSSWSGSRRLRARPAIHARRGSRIKSGMTETSSRRNPASRRSQSRRNPATPIAIRPPRILSRTAPWLRSYTSGCAARKACCSASRQRRHAVDVVMAVALHMRDAQQVDQRQVLLHRQAGLRRQVFGRHEVARRAFLARSTAAQRAALSIDLYRPLQVLDETPA